MLGIFTKHKCTKQTSLPSVSVYWGTLKKSLDSCPEGNLRFFFISKVWQTLYKFKDYYPGYHCVKFCCDPTSYKGRVSENVFSFTGEALSWRHHRGNSLTSGHAILPFLKTGSDKWAINVKKTHICGTQLIYQDSKLLMTDAATAWESKSNNNIDRC